MEKYVFSYHDEGTSKMFHGVKKLIKFPLAIYSILQINNTFTFEWTGLSR